MSRSFTEEQSRQNFWAKVVKNGPRSKLGRCWIWIAAQDGHGYGAFSYKGKTMKAYKYAYITEVGPIPIGKQLDHLCRTRSCVNPKHLEVVTQQENLQRGVWARRKGYCVKELHKLTAKNIYVNPTTGKPRCIACRDEYRRKYWLEKHDNRK